MSEGVAFQAGAIWSLFMGDYDGETKIQELLQHGDFGIGTFQGLDGELVALDSKIYQVPISGCAIDVTEAKNTVPFAVFTKFDSSIEPTEHTSDVASFEEFETAMDELLLKEYGTLNFYYFIRVDGTFPTMKVRSLCKQARPYERLSKVQKEAQVEFTYENTKGTLVITRFPGYMKTLTVPGYHVHYINDERSIGGHVLGFSMAQSAQVRTVQCKKFNLDLSQSVDFGNLATDDTSLDNDLVTIEKSRQ
ncbi:alpha-acetolactate decarboxylase [Basidiobolus meristosporus CBS 931.73]|uniref:Alpha-acetolactate decarboxylase n=1 Tax=Basidiobolus meristosporus CBS 931.73 TaxID=1314790 RepID=A0A1Y1XRI4_9FUNG|nr:alpha-acetolactate decarboxylase [Basidiobolus meristosporus CBS 931.73]|eukprot:ORX88372.1 alpha-acetolactate decarboxylase [Basidiobolus meristosporus CBS 931.73]